MISVSACARCISVCATMSASDFLCAHTHTHTLICQLIAAFGINVVSRGSLFS